jgi:hypothetical protein
MAYVKERSGISIRRKRNRYGHYEGSQEKVHMCHVWGRNAYKILNGKPEGKRQLRRPWHRWDDNIKMDLRKIVCGGVAWIHPAQDRDWQWAAVNMVMNLLVP